MNKAAIINARIERGLKNKAESIFHHLGISSAEAIRLFYSQVCLQKGLPFDVKIPNSETIKAMQDAEAGRNCKAFNSVEDMINDLNA